MCVNVNACLGGTHVLSGQNTKLRFPYFNTDDQIYNWLLFLSSRNIFRSESFRPLSEHCSYEKTSSVILQTSQESCLHFYVFSFDWFIYSDHCCMYKNPRFSMCSGPTKQPSILGRSTLLDFFFKPGKGLVKKDRSRVWDSL